MMRARQRLALSSVFLAVSIIAPLLGIAGSAFAQSPAVIYACVQQGSQQVRIVGAGEPCRQTEARVAWNVQGPMGPQGQRGEPGPQGPAGPPGAPGTNDTRVFRYNTFDTFLEACCWNAGDNASLFGGVAPSTWTDNNGLASDMSPDSEVLRTLFVRKLYPGNNALVSAERWTDRSSTNGKVTAVLMRIRNTTPSVIDWQPFFYFTAYINLGESASVAVNGSNAWSSTGLHYSNSTASPILTLPANQTSTVIFVVPSSPPWVALGGDQFRMNFFAFFNDSLNLPMGLSFVDDLDLVTGRLW